MGNHHNQHVGSWLEADRLAALDSYGILDTPPEQCFDDIVQLVGQIFAAPIVAVNLIAQGRQWFKSEQGLGVREMPLDDSICKVAILQANNLVVLDTLEDPRFACNKLVTGAPGLRFYAGCLLVADDGLPLGTLCVLDTAPRPQGVSEQQMFALQTLANQVMSQLELGKIIRQQNLLIAAKERADQAERAIAAELFVSRERFRAIVTQAATGVVQADPQGRLVLFNATFSAMLGYTEAELEGKNVLDVTAPDFIEATLEAFAKAAQGSDGFEIEKCYQRKDGSHVWAASNISALRGPDGELLGMVAIVVDISKRKRAEELLRASEQRLTDSDRRKTEFLATLAHELRNPLAPIRSGVAVMRMAADNPATMARIRDMLERQVSHMVRLIDDLLDIARISGGKLELKKSIVDLKTVIGGAVETSQPLIDAGRHALVLDIADEAMPVDVDATRIAQVIANLLNNAAKYTPTGGRIELSMRREGAHAVIVARDNGVGIPAASLCTVFDMFSQVGRNLDRAQGGLGIGLALVRRLVDLHDGEVTAASEGPGRGCTFTVRLPLASLAAPQLAGAPGLGALNATGLNILIADDNDDAAETLSTMLELLGHTTRVASGGRQALALAQEFHPDAVFLDIGMPGMNGYQTAQAMRATPGLENVILLALTGWGAESDHLLAREAGFNFHLTKPVELALLNKVLADLERDDKPDAARFQAVD
ncbi:MAG: PAS domain S-box protein [Pseudomonadota bacterium]